jgi:hypothetical protein
MVCKEQTEVYTSSGGMSLRPVRAARVLALVRGKGYKRAREGTSSQVSGGKVLCGCVSFVMPRHVLTHPRARDSSPAMTCHSVRP